MPKGQQQKNRGVVSKSLFSGKISFKNTVYFLIWNRAIMDICVAIIPENLKTANCTRFNTNSVTYVGFVEINFAIGNY